MGQDILREDAPMRTGPMTDAELAAIQARCDRASIGPWFFNSYNRVCSAPLSSEHSRLESERRDWDDDALDAAEWPEVTIAWIPATHGDTGDNPGDAEFIAEAREDVPRLLAEIARLKDVAAKAREEGVKSAMFTMDMIRPHVSNPEGWCRQCSCSRCWRLSSDDFDRQAKEMQARIDAATRRAEQENQ